MLNISKKTIELIDIVIINGYLTSKDEHQKNLIKEKVNNLLEEINERKKVSTSPTRLFNLLINTLLIIKNDENFRILYYVDTISKLTYNRYQINKEIEEEEKEKERALEKKTVKETETIKETETEQKALFKVKSKKAE